MIDEDVDYPSHVVTLAGLGHFFELFQQIIGGGDADLEPGIDLVGDARPGISTIELARYCEREGIFDLRAPRDRSRSDAGGDQVPGNGAAAPAP